MSEVSAAPALSRRAKLLLAAIELDLTPEGWTRFCAELQDRKVFVHAYPRRETLIVSPPLCISDGELADGLGRIHNALEAV